MAAYDVIVLGCGAVGGAALAELARRGMRVLGLDRYGPPHDRGSSHGRTRMIRQAYFEHPDYVPLVLRAYRRWAELEEAVGKQLYRETGLLEIGPPEGCVVPGVKAAARQHALEIEEFSAAEVAERFPGFRVPEGMAGVFERHAGFLHVEQCVAAHLTEAVRHGAEFHADETARAWRVEGAGDKRTNDRATVVVETDRGRYEAARLIVTAGAWATSLLTELRVPLVVRRKPQYWFAAHDERYAIEHGAPSFLYETDEGTFYGFPVAGPEGLKCAEHSGGATVNDPAGLSRAIDPTDLARVERFVAACLPGVTTRLNDHAPCMYTLSPDENFIVDRHPRHPQVCFTAGLSGHGFKFAPVLGEAMADLAMEARTELPIEFLGLQRFAEQAPR
jgi:monomeric sarcosine oxidase